MRIERALVSVAGNEWSSLTLVAFENGRRKPRSDGALRKTQSQELEISGPLYHLETGVQQELRISEKRTFLLAGGHDHTRQR
jgi:hypothetical protein